MKTLRFLGMTMIMVLFAVNFSACSDDDLDYSKLEGTWYITADEGFYVYGEEEERWNETYDSPQKMIKIKSLGDNKFEILEYHYFVDSEKWEEIHYERPDLTIYKFDGKKLILASDPNDEEANITILELSDTKMVWEFHVSDNKGEYYNKITFTKK